MSDMFRRGRHESRITNIAYRVQEEALESHWWQRSIARFCALAAVTALLVCGFLYWYQGQEQGQVLAAERVLDPDRVLTVVPVPQPIDPPLLEEGEDMRSYTRFREKTVALEVKEADLFRGFLILVNYNHILPENYQPEEIVVTNDAVEGHTASGVVVTKAGLGYNRVAAEKLFEMTDYAWETDGISHFLLQSGYRDFGFQRALHQNKVQEYRNKGYGAAEAEKAAAFWVARPRESEHNTGLAMDISSRSYPNLELPYAHDPNGAWLAKNCGRFGFVIRYPEDKSDITQIGFEPWHVRYVGHPHSVIMKESSWCLEEYLAFIKLVGGFTYRDGDGAIWQIDYQPFGGKTIEVPEELPYSISGDGEAGFIITTLLESAE